MLSLKPLPMTMSNYLTESDQQYRDAHRQPLRANFYWYTGDIPVVRPRDYKTARAILHKLEGARVVCAPLTSSEHTRLTNLIAKWKRRAAGQCPRFNVVGTRPGALTQAQRDRLLKLGWYPNPQTKTTKPPVPTKPCLNCRTIFPLTRSDKKYCSDWCRTHYWQRIYSGA